MDDFSNHPLNRVHNIDSAMSSLWNFYRKYFLSLFIIAVVISLILQYATTFLDFKEIQNIQADTDPLVILEKMKGMMLPLLIISLLNLFFTTILQHYIMYKPVDSNSSIFRSVASSFMYYLPYLLIVILLAVTGSIAVMLGLFALVVGAFFAALYVLTLYIFILPIMIAEGIDIVNTIRRVIKLAHKNFWSNIGWVSTFLVLFIVISFILSGLIMLPFAGNFLKNIFNPEDASNAADLLSNPVYLILTALVNAVTMPLMPIFACILYFNAKAREENEVKIIQATPEDGRVRVEDLYAKPYSDDHPDNPEKKDMV